MDTIEKWLHDINQKEKENDFFYKSATTNIMVEFFYISSDSIITDIKKVNLDLKQQNKITKNEFLYLISTYKPRHYKLLDILVYQMSLPANELKYMDNYEGLRSIKIIDDIQFENVIDYFKDLTTMYVLLYEKKKSYNNTRRIYMQSNTICNQNVIIYYKPNQANISITMQLIAIFL